MPNEDRITRTEKAHCDEPPNHRKRPNLSLKSSPIIALPTEILTAIFAMLSNDNVPGQWMRRRRHSSPPETWMHWVKLMLICQHWREVGLSSPWLWRRISITTNLESLRYRLSRTAGCTLDVFFSDDASVNESAMSLLIPLAPRIRSLQTIEDFPFNILPSIKPLFQIPLPALEYVKVLPYPGLLSILQDGDSEQSSDWFDLGLSGELHPRLRRLEVHRIVIPPPPAFFTTLRDLTIDLKDVKLDSDEHYPLSPEDIVNVFAHAPLLEALKICGCHYLWRYPSGPTVPENHVEPSVTATRYRLPCLRKVILKCPYLFAASILQAVDAPTLAVFHVEVSTRTPIVVADIGSLIFPPSLRSLIQQCTALLVAKSAGSQWGFQICDVKGPEPDTGDPLGYCIPLHLEVTDDTYTLRPLEAALTMMSDVFGVASQIRSLHFANFGGSASHTLWNPLHTTFPSLRSITVWTCSPHVIIPFLWTFLALSKEGAWPTARYLNISTGRDRMPNSLGVHAIADLLLATARVRAERGVPFASVVLEHDVSTSTPLVPHRWTLWGIHSVCDHFDFRIYHGRNHIPRRLGQFFTPAERRRLLDGSWDATGAPDQAADATTQTVDVDNLGDDEDDADEHVTSLQSMVLKELLQVVPVSV